MEHVLIRGNTLFCSHCKESIEVNLPMRLIHYADLLKAFGDIHLDCEEEES